MNREILKILKELNNRAADITSFASLSSYINLTAWAKKEKNKMYREEDYKLIRANSPQVRYLSTFGFYPVYIDEDWYFYRKSKQLSKAIFRYQVEYSLIPNKK